jgi:CheY-like chemotaxis protein/HPt (histidine-containing phosphotransfer) domain-containing protein
VRSLEGQGSTFWFSVELECQQKPAGKAAGEAVSPTPVTDAKARGGRILLAEDNPVNREVALAQLRKLGYGARAVENGAEAVEAVRSGSYDLVLMDCEMPVMDGFEATRRIRESLHSRIPIIAITADAMPADRARCLDGGMDDYMAKPVDLRQLADKLARWIPAAVSVPLPVRPPSAEDGIKVFDHAALLDRLMGDQRLARIVLKGFLLDAPGRLSGIHQRLTAADGPGARLQAHALQGAAATVAAKGLQALALAMEEASGSGQLDRCDRLLPQATEEFERFKTRLETGGWV